MPQHAAQADRVGPPSRRLLMMEGRALFELGAFWASLPWLRSLPKGDGHPVLALPGLAASDISTRPMRGFLKDRGYRAYGWDQGRNLGLRPGLLDGMLDRLDAVADRHGVTVSLVGWSLGGVFARELAKLRPELVRQVVSMGSPFTGNRRASHAWQFYELAAGHKVDRPPLKTTLDEPPPVPTTSIYSRSDGIVAWQCCHQTGHAHVENVEVEGSHCGLGHNPMVLYVLADRLSQPEGDWQPLDRGGLRSVFFRDPARDRKRTA